MFTLITVGQWLAANVHPHLLFYTVLVLFLLYRPPRILDRVQGIGDFITRHFGDSIGFYLLHLGVALFIIGGFYKELSDVQHIGESFILTGIGMLKLRYIPKNGANGPNGPDTLTPVLSPEQNTSTSPGKGSLA
jgi:hypothetical protein